MSIPINPCIPRGMGSGAKAMFMGTSNLRFANACLINLAAFLYSLFWETAFSQVVFNVFRSRAAVARRGFFTLSTFSGFRDSANPTTHKASCIP